MWVAFVELVVAVIVLYGFNIGARWRLRHIPGPRPSWLLGNLRDLGRVGMHEALPRYAREFGPVCKAFFGRFPIVVITDADLVKQVCIKQFMRFHDRQFKLGSMGGTNTEANCTMNHGMLPARGKYWAGLRASCEPVFHSGQLVRYAPLMNTAAEKLSARLLRAAQLAPATPEAGHQPDRGQPRGAQGCPSPAGGAAVDLGAALATMTLEVIGTSAFGVDFDTDKDDSRIVKEARFVISPPKNGGNNINRLGNILVNAGTWAAVVHAGVVDWGGVGAQQLLRPGLPAGHLSGPPAQREGAAGGGVGGARGGGGTAAAQPGGPPAGGPRPGHLQQGWGGPAGGQAKADSQRDYGAADAGDTSLLHHLMRAHNKETGEPFSELQIMAQGNTFLLAGYETTSTALSFAILCLIQNPPALAKLLAEVDAFPWKDGKGIGYQDLDSFPYTRAVIDEAMRVYPPVSPMVGLQREASSNAVVGGFQLRAGDKVWINVMGIHHDPKYWREPEAFKPERFIEGHEESRGLHPYAYIPFGAGPRKCIGYKFALEEAVIALAQLHRSFTFDLDPERHPGGAPALELATGPTLSVKGGLWVRPLPRS